jgi:hypothetical protein
MIQDGSMPENVPTIPDTVPPAGGDEGKAVERLCAVVERFRDYDGALHPSPVFGPTDREMLTRLQLIHCAHHLSFLVPKR